MAKGSSKKPGDPKCRGCGGLLEGRPAVRIGGGNWHQECAEKGKKFIPREYREPRAVSQKAQKADKAGKAEKSPNPEVAEEADTSASVEEAAHVLPDTTEENLEQVGAVEAE